MEALQGPVAFGIIILVVIFIITVLVFVPNEPKKEEKCIERFVKTPANFQMFNYFPKTKIKVDVIEKDNVTSATKDSDKGTAVPLHAAILPLKTEGIVQQQVNRYLKPGNILRFSIIKPDGKPQHYSDYVINTRDNERIKNLHIGMVTTRYIGNSTDGLRMTTTAGNAISGNAWLMIHNTTEIPLILNDGEIKVEPHSTYRYLGYLNQGVTLGTYFKDATGLYPDFQYLQPHSDIYYGIISDLKQPLYGCLQYEMYNDNCEYGQTLWPFADGIY